MNAIDRKNVLFYFFFSLFSLVGFSAHASINLGVEVNPNPVQPNEVVNIALTVGNSGASSTGSLVLQLKYPEFLNVLSNSLISDAGTCPGGSCSANEFLTWTLGTLAPGASITVTLPPIVWSGTPAGTLVSFEAEVFEDNNSVVSASRSVVVQPNSVFDIAIDEDLNPVEPGQLLTYAITFANRGAVNTTNTQLTFPLPAGVSFVSASGGGVLSNGVVTWNLQTFPAKKGGRRTVTVDVNNSVTPGSLLEVDAAKISGQANFVDHSAQALAVTRVASTSPLALAIELNPDPVQPNEVLQTALTVGNTSGTTLFGVTLQLRYNEWLNQVSNTLISDGGICPGSTCNGKEFLTWTLGALAPGASITVTLPPIVWSGTPAGTLVSFEAEVFEDNNSVVSASRSVVVQPNSVFDIAIDEDLNPVEPGQLLTYAITFANRGAVNTTNTQLTFPLPAGVSFVSASGGGVLSNGVVTWNLQTFPAKKGGRRTVTVDVNNSVTPGSLLEVDAAKISGQANFVDHSAQALAVTRVASTSPLALAIELNPDPVQPNEVLQTALTVGNTSGTTLFGVTLQLRYNEWLNQVSNTLISDGGICPGSTCNGKEFLTWTLGALAPGASITVTLPPIVWSGTPAGTLVSFEAVVDEDNASQALASQTVLVGAYEPQVCSGSPHASRLREPVGSINDSTPVYSWYAVPGASQYLLWVNDSTGNVINKWYTAQEASCSNESSCDSSYGICSITPTKQLASGNATWWIQSWNSHGVGPFSSAMNFNVGGPPPPTTLISPNSTITDTTPTYTWEAVPTSTWYYLWVNDSTGNVIKTWYTASQANCASGTGVCSITPSTVLANGSGIWWVQTWNSHGYGPWSEPFNFNVGGPPPPTTLVSPKTTIADTTPTYTWEAVSNSTWYYLWVNDSTGNVIKTWYTASQANCASGTGNCSVTPNTVLADGSGIWWVQTWNSNGHGPWSEHLNFNVGGPPPPTELIEPVGAISDNTPTYVWEAVPSSTWYYLWVNDSTGNVIKTWYTASQANCASGTGNCSITPGTVLTNGSGIWWVQTWNSSGVGPWSASKQFSLN